VLLVVVPDLRDRIPVRQAEDGTPDPAEPVAHDLLQPRVDIDTLASIARFVRERCGPQVEVHVKNPRYQTVRLSFDVKFHRGLDFHYHRLRLSTDLTRFLSPWAFDAKTHVSFGGRIYRSVLLDFVEELDYVDYVTEFRMLTGTDGAVEERAEAAPVRPDVILVSDASHRIGEVE